MTEIESIFHYYIEIDEESDEVIKICSSCVDKKIVTVHPFSCIHVRRKEYESMKRYNAPPIKCNYCMKNIFEGE